MTKSNLDTSVEEVWCPVRDLMVIWPDAQRPIRLTHLQSLIDGFDPELFDAVHVSPVVKAPSFRHIIDGNHRKTTAEQLFGPNEKIRCMVHHDCTTEARAAAIFRSINKGRRGPTAVEDFKVAVTEGSEVHAEIDKIVRRAGLTINTGEGKTISAVQSLLFVHSRYSAKALEAALRFLRDTWPDDRNAFQGPIISGYGALLFDHPKIDRDRLTGRIAKKFSPGTLLAAAKALKEASAKPIATEVKQVLLNHYNVGIKETQKLRSPEKEDDAASQASFRGYANGSAQSDVRLSAKSH